MLVATSGVIVVDRIAVDLPEEPHSGKTQFTKKPIEEHVGGHAANVAIDLVRLGMPPQEVGIIAAIGDDSAGDFIRRTIERYGIQHSFQGASISTGQDLILVPKGRDRSFNISPGANLELDTQIVKEALQRMQPKVLSIRPGYTGIDLSLPSILEGLSSTFVLLDFIRPFEKNSSYILPAIKYANVFHCNAGEAMDITGQSTPDAAIATLFSKGAQCLLITNGERGAQLITSSSRIKQPAFHVDAIDPTGCGDAFCAGIIKKVIEWSVFKSFGSLPIKKLNEMLRYAQAVGAACATGIGTTAGVSQEKVRDVIEGRGWV